MYSIYDFWKKDLQCLLLPLIDLAVLGHARGQDWQRGQQKGMKSRKPGES